ncbi:SOS response-associated peptidase family protein [Brevibacillus sp. RS1.1]|nr:SOS response-associated peptidase family protein [Brevibacillus sp. RS1.1]NRR00980.1 SOS response-associated peptidase family protein [Brevibacillus sp. RS1.1]
MFERKRCIVPADGFYEWQQCESGKQPMRIMMKNGEPFSFAGLFDTWMNSAGEKFDHHNTSKRDCRANS